MFDEVWGLNLHAWCDILVYEYTAIAVCAWILRFNQLSVFGQSMRLRTHLYFDVHKYTSMAIATLSVLHGYRETGITLALDKQEVRLHYCCMRVHLTSKMLLVLLDASHWEVVISRSCTIAPKHYIGRDVSVCVDLRSLHVWYGCRRVGAWRAESLFALLHVYLNLKVLDNYWCSMQHDAVSYIHSILLPK